MKILLADDHDLVRDALASLIIHDDDRIELTTVRDLEQALTEVRAVEDFDVIVLDLRMPHMNGLSGVQKMMVVKRKAKLILMSGSKVTTEIKTAMEMGVDGFIPKTLAGKALVNAVKLVATGEKYFPADLLGSSDVFEEDPLKPRISMRENQVLVELRGGNSNKEIARTLDISETTVKLHLRSLTEKLCARNRTDIVVRAIDLGLV